VATRSDDNICGVIDDAGNGENSKARHVDFCVMKALRCTLDPSPMHEEVLYNVYFECEMLTTDTVTVVSG
jgi:hypothetical protein